MSILNKQPTKVVASDLATLRHEIARLKAEHAAISTAAWTRADMLERLDILIECWASKYHATLAGIADSTRPEFTLKSHRI